MAQIPIVPPFGECWTEVGDHILLAAIAQANSELAFGTGGTNEGIAQGGYHSPTASTNGTELQSRPESTNGVRFEIPAGGSATYFIAATGQNFGSAPAITKQAQPSSGTATVDEPLSGTDSIYVTAVTGNVIFRWVQ